jgi:hypothetical protein
MSQSIEHCTAYGNENTPTVLNAWETHTWNLKQQNKKKNTHFHNKK